MSSHFERTRSRLRKLLGGEPTAGAPGMSSPIPDIPAEAWNAEYLRLMLSPAPGIAERLRALQDKGVLAILLPEASARTDSDDRVGAAIRTLDQFFDETTLTGKRFGSLLRELRAPDLLVLSMLLRDGPGHPPEDLLRAA